MTENGKQPPMTPGAVVLHCTPSADGEYQVQAQVQNIVGGWEMVLQVIQAAQSLAVKQLIQSLKGEEPRVVVAPNIPPGLLGTN